MNEIAPVVDSARARFAALRTRGVTLALVVGAGGVAGAQSMTPDAGSLAVQGLGLDGMIAAFAQAVRTLITDNGTALALVILPVLAWYFIRNQLRGSV